MSVCARGWKWSGGSAYEARRQSAVQVRVRQPQSDLSKNCVRAFCHVSWSVGSLLAVLLVMNRKASLSRSQGQICPSHPFSVRICSLALGVCRRMRSRFTRFCASFVVRSSTSWRGAWSSGSHEEMICCRISLLRFSCACLLLKHRVRCSGVFGATSVRICSPGSVWFQMGACSLTL